MVACRAEWETPLGYSRNWVREVEGMGADGHPWVQLFSGRCQHCDDPACVAACPAGAAWKREDGIVLVDDTLCSGCELCVPACPHEARWLNPKTDTIGKCTFCQPRVDAGLPPACVQTCVGGALHFGDANDPGSKVSRLLAAKEWVQLTTEEVPGGTSHYYYTGGRPLPHEVLPRPVGHHVQSTVLAEAVNPAAKAGIGGMLAFFAAAGLKKVIDRREARRDQEGHDE